MNDDSIHPIQDSVTDIPLHNLNDVQEDAVDPRLSRLYCLKVHERKKQFLSKLGQIPHKLLAAERVNSLKRNKVAYHSNAHNFEMINNPRDTPFFSLHGNEYEELVMFFDPRRTKTKDILGPTIYQEQAFLDVQEEIPASNDVEFENFFSVFNVDQSLDLKPLNLEETPKEDGEITHEFTLSPVSSERSIPVNKNLLSGQENLDDYRDLLIDVLVTKNPLKMKKTLKSSTLIQKALNTPNLKDVSPKAVTPSNKDHVANSFVEEKSVVGDKSYQNTPKVTKCGVKKSSLLRLASDPNHSFVDEFDRSLQPTSSSTPMSKLKANISSKRKKIDKPKHKSLKSNELSTQQFNKRPKTTNLTTGPHNDTESPISGSSLPYHSQISSLECENIEQPLQFKDNPKIESRNICLGLQTQTVSAESSEIINNELKSNDSLQSKLILLDPEKKAEHSTETEKSSHKIVPVEGSKRNQTAQLEKRPQDSSEERGSEKKSDDQSVCVAVTGVKVPTVQSGHISITGVKASAVEKTTTPTSNYILSEKESSTKTEQIALEKSPNRNSPLVKSTEASPKTNSSSKKQYTRDVCNSKALCIKQDRRKSTNILKTSPQNGSNNKSVGNRKSSSLLDAGLKSIRQIKGKDDQDSIGPRLQIDSTVLELDSNDTTNSALTNLSEIEEKLKPLAFKDRAIAEQLVKYCNCWIEETKHSACVDLYGEFLVTINNRYCQQLDMSIVNSALSILTIHSEKIDPDNFILKTALFTTKLLKLLHKSGRVTFPSRFQAHRGGGGEWTENTMSAFKQAELLGVELFELDVQLTRDGEVVVCHDDNLSRVCGVNENISEHLLSTLPLCLREMEVACEPGEYMRCEVQQPLVRLEDLYKHFPSTPMQMDLKPGGHDLISKVSDLTKKYKREHLTIWGAFSHKTTVACREHNPDILSFCSMWECSFYPLIMLLGLLPWVPIQADFYQVPIPNISNKSGFLSTFPKWLCQLVTPLMCNPLLLWHLEKRGVRTGAWVMNHHHEYQTADWYGFGGIMTDFPSRFVQYENERKKME